jgi:hypothetical protein
MKRIVMQFAGLWLGVSGAIACAQWNAPTFGNTYRVAYADQDSIPLPPAVDDAGLPAPAAEEESVMSAEPGMPMQAGPIGYGQGGYGQGAYANGAGAGYIGPGYGSEGCCEPTDPCAAGLWDGYWSAKHHWCHKGHGCGHGHCGLLPQINWVGGGCAHRACFNGGGVGAGCCGAGMGGHGLFGGHGFGGHGHGAECGCAEEVVEGDCGCEPCGHGFGHHNLLPQLNWVGGGCAHRACFNGGGVGTGGHGSLGHGLHGHHGVGVMQEECSSCGN